jgi:hypothetical protein
MLVGGESDGRADLKLWGDRPVIGRDDLRQVFERIRVGLRLAARVRLLRAPFLRPALLGLGAPIAKVIALL